MSAEAVGGPGPGEGARGRGIDVHAHCIPAAVLDTLERDSGRYGIELIDWDGVRGARIAGRVMTGPLRPDLIDTDMPRRLAAMDQAGVRVQLLSSFADLTAYALDPAVGARYARMFNEALVATAAAHPGRFLTLATVPLQAGERAATELRHAVSDLGMVGVEIATTVDGAELDDPGLYPFWRTAAELGCLVLIHPYQALAGRRVVRYFLGNLTGNPAESSIAVAHLIFGGVLERFSDLRICVVHGGGFLPWQAGRLDRGFTAKPEVCAPKLTRPPSEWLRHLYYDTILHSPAALAWLVAFAGADHVLLGSDYPFEMRDPTPVATVNAIPGLTDAERALILEGNLLHLLGHLIR